MPQIGEPQRKKRPVRPGRGRADDMRERQLKSALNRKDKAEQVEMVKDAIANKLALKERLKEVEKNNKQVSQEIHKKKVKKNLDKLSE